MITNRSRSGSRQSLTGSPGYNILLNHDPSDPQEGWRQPHGHSQVTRAPACFPTFSEGSHAHGVARVSPSSRDPGLVTRARQGRTILLRSCGRPSSKVWTPHQRPNTKAQHPDPTRPATDHRKTLLLGDLLLAGNLVAFALTATADNADSRPSWLLIWAAASGALLLLLSLFSGRSVPRGL